jgi:hypothetical protein
MAKAKVKESISYRKPPKKRRPGVHAKTKQSKNKRAKNYKKLNVGQG